MRSLKTNFEASLDLYADILLHPSFPQKDFERVQKLQILNIKQEQSEPRQLGYRLLPVLLYGNGHAYGNSITGTGTEESVSKIKREDLIKFHQTWFVANNAAMIVVGDITETELKSKLENKFTVLKTHEILAKNIGPETIVAKPALYIVDKPGAEQSVIFAAETGPSGSEEGFEAIRLMNSILGGSFMSRLNLNLREDKHWSYGAYSNIMQTKGPGAFIAYTSVQTDKTKESIVEIQKELVQINTTKPIKNDEFKKEQTNTVLSVPMDWESVEGIMDFLVKTVEFDKGKDYANNYTSMLQGYTLADIQKAAAKIQPERFIWLVIGDRTKIEKGILELNLGRVKFLDVNGNEIKEDSK
jgi:zinc protease